MIKALDVANTILRHGFSEKIKITPMKLQKLIYILYKEYLKKTGKSLFLENSQAWKTGPVLESVYIQFKKYKSKPIKVYFWEYTQNEPMYRMLKINSNEIFANTFYFVWTNYKNYDGKALAKLTMQEGGAWHKAVYEHEKYILLDKDIENERSYL